MCHLFSDPVHVVVTGLGPVCGRGSGRVWLELRVGGQTALGRVAARLLVLPPLDHVLALHGGAGGQAGGLTRLVLSLLGKPGQVVTLPLRPLVVRLGNRDV